MKKIILLLCLVSFGAFGKTLPQSGFVGSWKLGEELAHIGKIQLVINDELTFTIDRVFPDGKEVSCKATEKASYIKKDFLVLTCKTSYDITHRFILGGWESNSGSTKIFGTMFLYNNEGLFNGIPVYFTKT